MEPLISELKLVTAITSFKAIRVFDLGHERNALIDQDGDVLGLVENDHPYFIDGTFSDACIAANRPLRVGASYKAYPCAPFGQHHYVLDVALKPITELSDIPNVREAEEMVNQSISLLEQLKRRKECNVPPSTNEKIIN